jgi:hypothetical protein
MSLPIPRRVPALGFYYHYKHDPSGSVDNYAYEIIGVGFHTEDDARSGEEHFVVYRPLYEASVYKISKELGVPCFDTRPLEMWMGNVEVGGQTVPRFRKIVDTKTIRELEKIRDQMYSSSSF